MIINIKIYRIFKKIGSYLKLYFSYVFILI